MKKIMLGHIHGKRQQRKYGEDLVKRITEKLVNGWNPWIESEQPLEYTEFNVVCEKYKEYLFKLYRENNMREESVATYSSCLNILREWKEKKHINLF